MFSFENQGTSTFLTYALRGDQVIDTLALGMLINNKIDGLAEVTFTQRDSARYLILNSN